MFYERVVNSMPYFCVNLVVFLTLWKQSLTPKLPVEPTHASYRHSIRITVQNMLIAVPHSLSSSCTNLPNLTLSSSYMNLPILLRLIKPPYCKLGTLVWNILKTCTILLPTTTNTKKTIRPLLSGGSSTRSPAFPMGTCPRLLMFSSNLELRFLMALGAGILCCYWH